MLYSYHLSVCVYVECLFICCCFFCFFRAVLFSAFNGFVNVDWMLFECSLQASTDADDLCVVVCRLYLLLLLLICVEFYWMQLNAWWKKLKNIIIIIATSTRLASFLMWTESDKFLIKYWQTIYGYYITLQRFSLCVCRERFFFFCASAKCWIIAHGIVMSNVRMRCIAALQTIENTNFFFRSRFLLLLSSVTAPYQLFYQFIFEFDEIHTLFLCYLFVGTEFTV